MRGEILSLGEDLGQPDKDLQSDSQGRFSFDAAEGKVSFTVWFQELQTSVECQAGDTNVVAVIKPKSGNSDDSPPKRGSLIGRSLPSLTSANLQTNAAAAGKPVLLCLFESQQRPSRRAIRVLSDQYESLRQKGVTVLAIQAAVVADDAYDQWKQENSVPFKIGRITEKTPATRWATETESLPWLMLVNSQGRVIAEGFSLEDMPGKIENLGK